MEETSTLTPILVYSDSDWTSLDPVLNAGWVGIVYDTQVMKIGDGSTAWSSLPVIGDVSGYASLTASNTFTERQIFQKVAYSPEVALTYGATTNWNLDAAPNARVTLTGDVTIAAPTNAVQGATYRLRIIQDGTGGWLVTFNSAYKVPFGASSAASPGGPNDQDYYEFYCYDGAGPSLLMVEHKGYAL